MRFSFLICGLGAVLTQAACGPRGEPAPGEPPASASVAVPLGPGPYTMGPAPALPVPMDTAPPFRVEPIDERLEPLVRATTDIKLPRGAVDVRGTFFAAAPGQPREFLLHTARHAVFVAGEAWALVDTSTGLWLHEGASLARRARIAPHVDALAADATGDRFAFAVGRRVVVASFPSLQVLASFDGPRVHRMRFGRDALAIASRADEEVALYDLQAKRLFRYDVDDEVNDAIPLDPGEVGYATDADALFVRRMADGVSVFDSKSLKPAGYYTRDMNAIAYDPATGRLFGGSEDNKVWTFTGFRTASPTGERSADYTGDVDDLSFAGGTLYAGLDSIAVFAGAPDGDHVGPYGDRTFSDPVRVDVGSAGTPLLVLDGHLARWSPNEGRLLFARDTLLPSSPGGSFGALGFFGEEPSGRPFFVPYGGATTAAHGSAGVSVPIEPLPSMGTLLGAWGFAGADVALVLVNSAPEALDPAAPLARNSKPGARGRAIDCVRIDATTRRVTATTLDGPFVSRALSAAGTSVGVLDATGQVFEVDGSCASSRTAKFPPPAPNRWLRATSTGWTLVP